MNQLIDLLKAKIRKYDINWQTLIEFFLGTKNLNYFACKLGLGKIGIWHDMTYEMKSTMIQNIRLTLVYYYVGTCSIQWIKDFVEYSKK